MQKPPPNFKMPLFNYRKSSNKANLPTLPTLPVILAHTSTPKPLSFSAAPDRNNLTTSKTTNPAPRPYISRRKRAKRKCCEKLKKVFKTSYFKKPVMNNQSISESVGINTTAQEVVPTNNIPQLKSSLKKTTRYDQKGTPVSPEKESQNLQSVLENSSIEDLLTSYKDTLCSLENYEMCIDYRIREQKEPPDWRSLLFLVEQNGPEHTPKTVIEWQLVHLRVQYLMSHIEKQAFVDESHTPYMKEASAGAWRRLNKQLANATLRKVELAKNLTAETEKLEKLQPGLTIDFDPQNYFNNMEKPAKLFSSFLATATGTFTLPFSKKQEELRMHPDERNGPKLLSDLVFADEKYRLMLAELNYFKFLLQKTCSSYSHEHLSGLEHFSDLVSCGIVSA